MSNECNYVARKACIFYVPAKQIAGSQLRALLRRSPESLRKLAKNHQFCRSDGYDWSPRHELMELKALWASVDVHGKPS